MFSPPYFFILGINIGKKLPKKFFNPTKNSIIIKIKAPYILENASFSHSIKNCQSLTVSMLFHKVILYSKKKMKK